MFLNFLFLLILFPLSLLIYHCVPLRWQQPVLLGTSILFLVLWQAECSLLFFGLIFLTGLFSRLLAHLSPHTLPARLLLLFHDAIYIAALFFLRPPHEGHLFGVTLYPVGISILALQSISYVHLIVRRAILPEQTNASFAFYFCFYPKLLFGPYVSVSTFHRIQPNRRCQAEQVGNGLHQLVCGLAKAVLLSGQFYLILQQMQAARKEHNTFFFSWPYQLLFFLYVYFQITGYTDMARGIAACYGYALPKSSRLPLWNKQLSVFLQNWNRTVLRWFSRAFSSPKQTVASLRLQTLLTYSVLGWFCRGTLTGFLGGLLIGVILEWFEDVQRKWKFPTAIHWFLSIICSVFAWSLFCSDTLTEAVQTWGNLLGLSKDAVSYQDLYFLQSSLLLLLIAGFCTSGWHRSIQKWLKKRTLTAWIPTIVVPVGDVLFLGLSVLAMANNAVPPLFLRW